MSRETAQAKREQAEAMLAALNARDFEAIGDMPLHPDMTIRSLLFAVEGGTIYHGIQGLRQWAQDIDSVFDDLKNELIDLHEVDHDRAVVVVRVTGRAKGSGIPVDDRRGHIWTWRKGKLWRTETFPSPDEAFKTAGLSDQSLAPED